RAELPDDGEVSRQDIPVPDALWAQWEEEVQQSEFKSRNQPHLTFLRGEPKLGLLRAMEAFDEQAQTVEPGALMTQNVVEYRPRPERAESTVDAIAISLDETRRIDLARISALLDVDEAQARQMVLDHAFVDPASGEFVSAVTYLSVEVHIKLDVAREAAADDDQFQHNVEELERVLPDANSIQDVTETPVVQWVPQEPYNDFVRDTFE